MYEMSTPGDSTSKPRRRGGRRKTGEPGPTPPTLEEALAAVGDKPPKKRKPRILKNPKRAGRPSTYDEGKAIAICDLISTGQSLVDAAQSVGVPHATVYRWLDGHPGFRDKYALACKQRGDFYGYRVAQLAMRTEAGEVDPQAARVAMDGYKWTAARMASGAWGDKQQVEVNNPDGSLRPILVVPARIAPDEWSKRVRELGGPQKQLPQGDEGEVIDVEAKEVDAGGESRSAD